VNRQWRLPIGVLLMAVGALWTLQGLGFVGDGTMSGVTLWAVVGPVVGAVGLLFVLRSRHPPD
jgi:hypothetical protein